MRDTDSPGRILVLDPAIRVIMISGSPDTSLKPKAMEMGAFAYVAKPVGLGQLHQTVAAALEQSDPLAPPRSS